MMLIFILITLLLMLGYCSATIKLINSQLRRVGISAFWITAATFALIRIVALWFLNSRLQSHTYTAATTFLSYLLLPEGAVVYRLGIQNPNWHMALFTALLVLGSCFWTFPLLLIGSKRKATRR